MAENTYYIPPTTDYGELREGLNASDIDGGYPSSRPGFVDKLHEIDEIDKADKYVIRHKFGEHIREGEDIDETRLPSHIAM
jgi:hypothetical protein